MYQIFAPDYVVVKAKNNVKFARRLSNYCNASSQRNKQNKLTSHAESNKRAHETQIELKPYKPSILLVGHTNVGKQCKPRSDDTGPLLRLCLYRANSLKSSHQQNKIPMAFRWRADAGPFYIPASKQCRATIGPLSARQRNAISMADAGPFYIPANKQCRTTLSQPAKRHFNGVSLADRLWSAFVIESGHGLSNNVACATSKASNQPAHTRSLTRALASMTVKLLTKHHLEFLSLKGGCTGSPKSTLVLKCHIVENHMSSGR